MTACEGILHHKETFPTYNAAYYIQIDSNAMAKTVMDVINSWNGTESETNSFEVKRYAAVETTLANNDFVDLILEVLLKSPSSASTPIGTPKKVTAYDFDL